MGSLTDLFVKQATPYTVYKVTWGQSKSCRTSATDSGTWSTLQLTSGYVIFKFDNLILTKLLLPK